MTLLRELVEKHAAGTAVVVGNIEISEREVLEARFEAFGRELLMKVAEEIEGKQKQAWEDCKEFKAQKLTSIAWDARIVSINCGEIARRLRELASAGEGKNG
jgi:hypothetical protein